MKYLITVRKLKDSDLSHDCKFPVTELDEYQKSLVDLVEDIESINSINSVSLIENDIHIESKHNQDELLKTLKPLFQRDFCVIRFVSISLSNDI